MAPAKTFHPLMEDTGHDYHCLCHGNGVRDILDGLCSRFYTMGAGRSRSGRAVEVGVLVLRDILRTWRHLGVIDPDLVLTCGNAGDVRKAIAASRLRGIGVIHVEQDIYNPIEMIAFADTVTAPSAEYRDYLEDEYLLENVEVIGGYPHALYVSRLHIEDPGIRDYTLLVLGGDLRRRDVPEVISGVEALDRRVLVVPFRFSPDYVRGFVRSGNVEVLEGFVDLPSLMSAADLMVYGAGMGVTIEAAVLGVPSIKIRGFHVRHASVDLARQVGIPVADAGDLRDMVDDVRPPEAASIVRDAEVALSKLSELVEDFHEFAGPRGGLKSMRRIWDARRHFR
ncbi:hypothetical protein DNK57_03925 [Methanothermobacter thermautotrophicus]|jgi:UDP-N-acetylglucosamine:LPS N-acetylglucosamine transferase|uniref:DUF354 domain-containing protein n=1 Tax=Methanothermobacter thermautotrophicus TaxID=145262 RepID=A0A842YLY4_METTF|nr:hypothetical protein [Methanothermobacter thermautotrophicus]MBE2899967.1 hypothetical protein [Methanothermobacter thermautotrophicus]